MSSNKIDANISEKFGISNSHHHPSDVPPATQKSSNIPFDQCFEYILVEFSGQHSKQEANRSNRK